MKVKPPIIHIIIGWGSIAISLIIGGAQILNRTSDQWPSIALLILLFGGLGILILVLLKKYTLEINKNGISQISHNGWTKDISWDQIEKIKYNVISRELTIYSANSKLKTHSDMIGFGQLYNLLAEKTNIELPEI
jgi:hypothetical protein